MPTLFLKKAMKSKNPSFLSLRCILKRRQSPAMQMLEHISASVDTKTFENRMQPTCSSMSGEWKYDCVRFLHTSNN